MLDVFIHGSSGVFKLTAKSARLGSEFNAIVSITCHIPMDQYKLFYNNRPLQMDCPIGQQLSHGCSVFLHILGKGGGGGGAAADSGIGNISDLQGVLL